MEYIECHGGCGHPLFLLVLVVVAVVASLLAVRRRAWTFVGALAGLPLAEWYLDGLPFGLLFLAALLVGGLAGLAMTSKTRLTSSGEAA